MESTAPVVAFDQSVLDKLAAFLKTATDVYHTSVALHDVESSSMSSITGHDLTSLSDDLSLSIQQIQNQVHPPADSTEPEYLMRACIKVGQVLSVHLDRAHFPFSSRDADQVDAKEFCAAWPRENVDALGSRLSELMQRWEELRAQSTTGDVVQPLSLSPLSLRDMTAGNDDKSNSTTEDETSAAFEKDGLATSKDMMFDTAGSNTIRPRPPRLAPVGIINDFLLDALAYKSMYDREEEVTEAHDKTLEWIFDGTVLDDTHRNLFSSEFKSWMSASDLGSIYWITGKPGSGKSTLVRFLSHHPVAMDHLRYWAKGRPVCTAGFFFWTSGSQEQRSQTGLLRYLLHQLLSANPELMPSTFPVLWQKLRQMTTKERINLSLEWTVPDLMAAFKSLLDTALPLMNICLFVDGLDEFEGDHTGIVDFFKSISAGKNGAAIKMCLSSRPWSVFEDAFGTSVPNARLQDLTYEDMHRYARDQLRGDAYVRRLFKKSADAGDALVEAAVQRADGVFLWVRLAVERMLSLFQKYYTMEDLNATLESFPRELDGFFNKLVFEDQTEAQIAETAVLFQLLCAREAVADFIKDESSTSLTVWELAFALGEADDAIALEREVAEATDEEIVSRCEATALQVHARFSGLLSLHRRRRVGNLRATKFADENHRVDHARSLAEHKITYIHRTVRDWLMDPSGAHNRLQSIRNASFDPHLRLLRSYVLRLKYPLEEVEHHRRLDEWYPDIALAMSHARCIANDPKGLQRPFLNAMEETLSWYWLGKLSDPFDHWARSSFGSYEVRMKAPPIRHPFVLLAAKFGLTDFIIGELADDNLQNGRLGDADTDDREPTPLLSYAIEFLCSRNKTLFPLSDPRLVAYLLSHPSKSNPGPNHQYTDFNTRASTTPWLTLLRHLRDARRRGWIEHYDISPDGTERWVRIVRLFIEGGADLDAVVVKNAWDPEITALGVFELLDETYGAVEVQEIKSLIAGRQEQT
ncbi:hypothetical protein B0J13DRAFT_133795 [Dactylonectria estremocensis]|uniref:NACHT domain-containing protein n=1 Tax=Dactylonectria estremocensis TaxID=1079267 RepID=A0A9P9E2N4_9HYPO|nr:hypothetical protein B0J13DRAFT_133795 [Dactylonectria estremocensis]